MRFSVFIFGLVIACNSDDKNGRLHIDFDSRPNAMCQQNQCDDFGLRCGALMSIRWFTNDGERSPILDASGSPFELCQPIDSSDALCSLSSIETINFLDIPKGIDARVEVGIWENNSLNNDECPRFSRDPFDLEGFPRTDSLPQPAFAGLALVNTDSVNIELPLSCVNPNLVDQEGCEPLTIEAEVIGLDLNLPLPPSLAAQTGVSLGAPLTEFNDDGELMTTLTPNPLYELSLMQDAMFVGVVPEELNGTLCVQALDQQTPESTANVVCFDPMIEDRMIHSEALLLPKSKLDAILSTLGEIVFPPQGLVVGRVVDSQGNPESGVDVLSEAGTIQYLDETMQLSGTNVTTPSGYFVSRNMSFGTILRATHPDGQTHTHELTSGLIEEKLSLVQINLTP